MKNTPKTGSEHVSGLKTPDRPISGTPKNRANSGTRSRAGNHKIRRTVANAINELKRAKNLGLAPNPKKLHLDKPPAWLATAIWAGWENSKKAKSKKSSKNSSELADVGVGRILSYIVGSTDLGDTAKSAKPHLPLGAGKEAVVYTTHASHFNHKVAVLSLRKSLVSVGRELHDKRSAAFPKVYTTFRVKIRGLDGKRKRVYGVVMERLMPLGLETRQQLEWLYEYMPGFGQLVVSGVSARKAAQRCLANLAKNGVSVTPVLKQGFRLLVRMVKSGWWHRDLYAVNIMQTSTGRLKAVDLCSVVKFSSAVVNRRKDNYSITGGKHALY